MICQMLLIESLYKILDANFMKTQLSPEAEWRTKYIYRNLRQFSVILMMYGLSYTITKAIRQNADNESKS